MTSKYRENIVLKVILSLDQIWTCEIKPVDRSSVRLKYAWDVFLFAHVLQDMPLILLNIQ